MSAIAPIGALPICEYRSTTFSQVYAQALAADATFAGALGTMAMPSLAGALGFAGSLASLFVRQLTASAVLTFDGSMSRFVGRALVAGIAPAGELWRRVERAYEALCAFAGTVARALPCEAMGTATFDATTGKGRTSGVDGSLSATGAAGRLFTQGVTGAVLIVAAWARSKTVRTLRFVRERLTEARNRRP